MTVPAPLPRSFVESIRAVVGPHGCLTEPAAIEPFLVEARGLFRGRCAMVVRPTTTDEVARVVALCADAGVSVVPQGGNTGLCGGGVPDGGIVLSLARLNRVRALDAANHTITVEAGCILADVQQAAADAGCLFPLSLGAEGSCRIGGNIATNAGGVHVVRYGTTRDLVLGLEVVLADGRVWDGLRSLRKDNTGYDLKQLFIGAEGTLGIVTAAVLKLFPRPRARAVALAGTTGADRVLTLFTRIRDACGEALTAFEFMSRFALECALKHVPGNQDPLSAPHAHYALIELASPRADDAALRADLEAVLNAALDDGVIADAAIAASDAQIKALWRLRETITEAQKGEGGSIKHDIAVPVSKVPEFLARAERVATQALPGVRVCAFGHLGDGNIHYNLSQPLGMDRAAFMAEWDRFSLLVHDLVGEMGGSFSAEHGIGRLKLAELERYKEDVEIDLMRTLKRALDPKNILNPGKVVRL